MSLSTPILTTSSEIDTRVDDCSATAVVMKDDTDKAQMMSIFLIMGLPPQDEQRGTTIGRDGPRNPITGIACWGRRERPRSRRAAKCGQQLPPSDGDCHAPLPCEVRKGNDTTPRACSLHVQGGLDSAGCTAERRTSITVVPACV